MTTRNQSLIINYNEDGSIGGAEVTRVTRAEGIDFPLPPLTVSVADLSQYTVPIDAAVMAERDAMAAQVQSLTNQLSQLQSAYASLVTDRDDHAIQAARVPGLVSERASLISQVEQLQSANASLAAQIESLQAQLDALLHPPGPDLSTLDGVKTFISSTRYTKETSGITIEGQQISTERDEIGHWLPRFYNAYQWLQGDAFTRAGNPTGEYPYKPKQGEPVLLSAAQVVRAYLCLSWYINACFAVERGLYQLAEGGSLSTAIDATNANSTWPQTEFTWEAPQ